MSEWRAAAYPVLVEVQSEDGPRHVERVGVQVMNQAGQRWLHWFVAPVNDPDQAHRLVERIDRVAEAGVWRPEAPNWSRGHDVYGSDEFVRNDGDGELRALDYEAEFGPGSALRDGIA